MGETQLDIEFTIKKPIETQCKTAHPLPLSPSAARCTGRGEQDQKVCVDTVADGLGFANLCLPDY